uniref:Uncharacterized protein n=1 Tax=Ditylenchus dipsaci TaxID=166011 RepID=A0A915E530_9BILA
MLSHSFRQRLGLEGAFYGFDLIGCNNLNGITSSGASSAQYSPPANVLLYSQQPHQWFYTNNEIPAANESLEDGGNDDIENEPPLLEELGINFQHIRQKTLAVLNPVGSTSADVIVDQDLAGPLVFCLLFGASLLLQGKIHFRLHLRNWTSGMCWYLCFAQLMATDDKSISFTCTASVLGYASLTMALLSMLAAVLTLQGLIGYVIAGTASSGAAHLLPSSSPALSMEGQKTAGCLSMCPSLLGLCSAGNILAKTMMALSSHC